MYQHSQRELFLWRRGCPTIYMIIKYLMSCCFYILSESYLCFWLSIQCFLKFLCYFYIVQLYIWKIFFGSFSFVTYVMHDFYWFIDNFIYEYCIHTIPPYILFPSISSFHVLSTPPQIHSFTFCKYNSYKDINVYVSL